MYIAPPLPSLPFSSLPPPSFVLLQAKKANKEVPKDDEEIERKEDGDIAFVDSSSSDEEELTEKGISMANTIIFRV